MERFVIVALVCTCFASALAVVHSTHQSRKLFPQLRELEGLRDDLDAEWGRLQLEQSTFATHGHIEAVAHDKLGMHMPQPSAVVIVKP